MRPKGVGNGSSVPKKWTLAHNWREADAPVDGNEPGWIPPDPKDVLKKSIKLTSIDPQSPDFLRPTKDSPLATNGAGKDDPMFPSYVGASPPQGVRRWIWPTILK